MFHLIKILHELGLKKNLRQLRFVIFFTNFSSSGCRIKHHFSCLQCYLWCFDIRWNTPSRVWCITSKCLDIKWNTLSRVWSFYVEWSTLPRVWCITFWCLNIRWNSLYSVWYITSGVLISDETLLLVFDALLLGVWTSNKTLLFMLIRYPGIYVRYKTHSRVWFIAFWFFDIKWITVSLVY